MAAGSSDDAERLAEAVADAPVVVEGSAGQPRPNPLAKELRDMRQLLGRLLAQLEIPSDEPGGEWDNPTTSERARKAAHLRWMRG